MKEVFILVHEIIIDGNYYPFNKIYFNPRGVENIQIFSVGGDMMFDGPYNQFVNTDGEPFASQAAVINMLKRSFV